MGASYRCVLATAETIVGIDGEQTPDPRCAALGYSGYARFAAVAYHKSGVLVWCLAEDEDGADIVPPRAEWVPYPDDGPTLLTNMTEEQRARLGLPDSAWAELCAGLAADEVRRARRHGG